MFIGIVQDWNAQLLGSIQDFDIWLSVEFQSPQAQIVDFMEQHGADLPALRLRIVPGKPDEALRVAPANAGDILIGFFVSRVVDGEDHRFVDAGLTGVLKDHLRVGHGVPGCAQFQRVTWLAGSSHVCMAVNHQRFSWRALARAVELRARAFPACPPAYGVAGEDRSACGQEGSSGCSTFLAHRSTPLRQTTP